MNYSFLIAICLSLFAFNSIKSPEKDIVGVWSIDESLIPKTVEKILARVEKSNPEQAAALKQQKELIAAGVSATTLEFKENKEYILTTGFDNIPRIGSWDISIKDSTLIRTDSKGEISKGRLIEINDLRFRIIKSKTNDTITYNKIK